MPGDGIYWDDRYRTVGHANASWYQHRPLLSLRLIEELGVAKDAAVVDVGGGASALVDCLLEDGFTDITVVDLSQVALDEARGRLADREVEWIQADVRKWAPARVYDLWHDRATYHFLTSPDDQHAYWQTVREHVSPGGHVIVATFALDGPSRCSGLPVQRYDAGSLGAAMGEGFGLIRSEEELHHTPGGADQPFTWVVAART
jgi:2-polyprenyl-3-methyl-5-hydroxy-6-metoxy-1,4-benzoquinol methylase